jgi:cell division protein FtsQ
MKINFKIQNKIKVMTALAVLFVFIAFSESRQGTVIVHDISIKIENLQENHFIDDQDIIRLMQLDNENIKGAPINRLNLKEIEKRIKTDRYIKDAELYSDIKGNLVVKATLRRPIARIVRSDAPDAYIAEDGTLMPVSEKFTARVVLISGPYVREYMRNENIHQHEDGEELMKMLKVIQEDLFWHAQIAQLDIDSKGRISILPQIGNQTIEFGQAESLEIKLKKLKIFYKEILPQMGWNKYKRVSLEYEGQIVAE